MLQGTKINFYFMSKLLANSDYLCYDKYSCSYLLAENKHKKVGADVALPYIINAVDIIEEENISYSCYHLFENIEWIGDISKTNFLSEAFCLSILYNFVNKIILPLLQRNLNPSPWIHINNIWVKKKHCSIYLISHKRNAIQGQEVQQLIKKIGKIFKPMFSQICSVNQFLSFLFQQMISCHISFPQLSSILEAKQFSQKVFSQTSNFVYSKQKTLFFSPMRKDFNIRRHKNYKQKQHFHETNTTPMLRQFSRKNKNKNLGEMFKRENLKIKKNKVKKRFSTSLSKQIEEHQYRFETQPSSENNVKIIMKKVEQRAMKKFSQSILDRENERSSSLKERHNQFKTIFKNRAVSTVCGQKEPNTIDVIDLKNQDRERKIEQGKLKQKEEELLWREKELKKMEDQIQKQREQLKWKQGIKRRKLKLENFVHSYQIILTKQQKKSTKSIYDQTEKIRDGIQEIALAENKKQEKKVEERCVEKKIKREKLINKNILKESLEKLSLEEIFLNQNQKQKQKTQSLRYQQNKKNSSTIQSILRQKKQNSISKIVSDYLLLVNKIGEAAAKSSNMNTHKLGNIEWFTGMYFMYKRFIYERKKIQNWLENGEAKVARVRSEVEKRDWEEWLGTEEKGRVLEKLQKENETIVNSIIKMNKKMMKKKLPPNILFYASLQNFSSEESKIIISEVVKQFDSLEEKQMLDDQQIRLHITESINALFLIAQLDCKIKQKKALSELTKKERSIDELSQMTDFIYELYLPQNQ